MSILLKNAKILKMDDTPIFDGSIVVDNNRISYIGSDILDESKYDQVVDCEGNLLMPGFKDAHTHNAMVFLRSRSDDLPLKEWLFDKVFPYEAKLQPGDVYWLSQVAILEFLTSGITACMDQYMFYQDLIDASLKLGFRTTICGIYAYSVGGTRKPELTRDFRLYNTPKDSLIRYAITMHAEYTGSEEMFKATSELVHELKCPFYVHLSETYQENVECVERRGMSPMAYYNSLGMFDYGGAIYHGVYLSDEDLKIIKDKNVSIISNPGSNLKLASGVAELVKYQELGINVALGTDGPASNNCLDMFKEMMLAANLQKLIKKDPSVMPAYDVLKMATVNSAKAIGLFDADILEVGKLADIIMIDLSRPNMQPIHNIANNIVYSGSKDNVKMTMIDGKILYYDRKFLCVDNLNEIYEKCAQITKRIIEAVEKPKA